MADRAPTFNPQASNVAEYSVSEIAGAVKRMVEERFGRVRVRGEISGWKVHGPSGHAYFSLKDQDSVLNAVCWKGSLSRVGFRPEDGLEIIATGKVTTYPSRSNYQLSVELMEPAGAGALAALFEKRKAQLAAEGLFDPSRRKPIPFLPEVIGVVTSPSGAVIRDILHRIADRFPVHVLVWPVAVQGEAAAGQIANAIMGFNAIAPDGNVPKPDILIVARGGGSIEDLWAFNEEIVVRAAAASVIPLISAVGHETDTTLIDFVSDRRAPTPTAAAEMAVPVAAELSLGIQEYGLRLRQAVTAQLNRRQDAVKSLARGLPRPRTLLEHATQRLDDWSERLSGALPALVQKKAQLLERFAGMLRPQLMQKDITAAESRGAEISERLKKAMERGIDQRQAHLDAQVKLLEALNYKSVLKRGYALVTTRDGILIDNAASAIKSRALTVTFHDGDLKVTAD